MIRLRRGLFEPLLFLALAVAATWPLATHLVGHLPLGSEEAATVPLFNLWIMWWNSDRAAAGFADYWQAPIFYPARDALASLSAVAADYLVPPQASLFGFTSLAPADHDPVFRLGCGLVTVALALIGAIHGLVALVRRFGRGLPAWPVLLVAAAVALFEILPPCLPLFALPQGGSEPAWGNWLKEHSEPHRPIVCLPFAFKPDVRSYEQETLWMYYQTMHRRPLLNGYSAYFPEEFKLLKWSLATFPSHDSLALLEQEGVRYCVVQLLPGEAGLLASPSLGTARLSRVFGDSRSGVEVFRLDPPP